MKISQLISVLKDMKKYYGDKYIWSIDDLDFPCPREVEIELSSVLKRTDFGMNGGKSDDCTSLSLFLEYEDGVDLVDRCFEVRDRDG